MKPVSLVCAEQECHRLQQTRRWPRFYRDTTSLLLLPPQAREVPLPVEEEPLQALQALQPVEGVSLPLLLLQEWEASPLPLQLQV